MTQAQTEWARCSGWLSKSLQRSGGFYKIEDCARMVESGQLQFWPMKNSAVLTEIIFYPNGKSMNAFVSGGNLSELRDFERALTAYARELGCRWIMGQGRRGWVRATAAHGYRELGSVLIKEI